MGEGSLKMYPHYTQLTHGGMENVFFEKKKRRESFPLILRAFDFAGRYIRSFIPEGLLSIYEQILMI